MQGIRAAIFDMDGLMIDSEGLSVEGWLEAGRILNVPLTEDFVNQFRGTNENYSRALCLKTFGDDFDYAHCRQIHDEYISRVIHRDGITVKPGLIELLDWLEAQGIPCAVATSTSQPRAEERLRVAGLYDRFAAYVYGSQVKRSKPDPEIFQLAAAALGAAPEESAVFEDSPNGVMAGLALGGLTFAVPDRIPIPEESAARVTALTKTLADTIPVLRERMLADAAEAKAREKEAAAPVRVTLIGHSGVLAELPDATLLFDWWKGDLPAIRKEVPLYVFASHAHGDHFSPKVFDLAGSACAVHYVLSDDIRGCAAFRRAANAPAGIHWAKPGDTVAAGSLTVHAYASTDEGCAFAAETSAGRIWHAGDLNWWTWPGEETQEEFTDMTVRYRQELQKAAADAADDPFVLAFVPLDPRQEKRFSWGMAEFLRTVGAAHIVPIHCWEDETMAERFLQTDLGRAFKKELVPLMCAGQSAVIG